MSSQKRRRIDDSDDDEPFRPAIDPSLAKGDSDVDYDDNEDEDNDDDENNNGVDDGPRRNVMRPYLERMNRRAAGEDDDSFDGDQDEDEGEGEDLINNAEADYVAIDALDRYDSSLLDQRDYASMSRDDRLKAEEELARREARNRGIEDALWGGDEEDEEAREERRRRFEIGSGRREDSDEEEKDDIDEDLNLEGFDVPLREWLASARVRREIEKRFTNFLESFIEGDDDGDDGDDGGGDGGDGGGNGPNSGARKRKSKRSHNSPFYPSRIRLLCANNASTLEVSFLHLSSAFPTLAIWLADVPLDILPLLDTTATRYCNVLFPKYNEIRPDGVNVRICDLPISDSLRDLREQHLNQLIKVSGVVTRRGGVQPQLSLAMYDCTKCNALIGPFAVTKEETMTAGPTICPMCQNLTFKLNTGRTRYRNLQYVVIQETPGTVKPGRVPRSKTVVVHDDLIDRCRPGEEVEITGVYTHGYDAPLSDSTGFPVFSTKILANHILKREDLVSASNLTEADKAEILKLGRDPKIGSRVINSIAPSIFGHKHVKMAIALSLFGGVPKNINDKHKIRGDINVLLLGDPGTAKSQILKYAEKTAPRAVYSTGKGASAVGLTAAVRKDPITKEWMLEGGALVLADRGLCLIDEFDKMNEKDRTSIHEAMEQQSISVSKAGIVTSLQARCSVIAAANPIGGRYDSSCTLAENVELTDPILQRFDCLCVLQDKVDPVEDEHLAKFVTGSHMKSTPTSEIDTVGAGQGAATMQQQESMRERSPLVNDLGDDTIPQSLLRKYIQYARTFVRPQLRGFDQEKIASLYVDLRRESANSGGVPIAVRHIESIMRMAEAHAKLHLRDFVREDDMDAAIKCMLDSFIQSQKFSVRRSLAKGFRKFLATDGDKTQLLLHTLQKRFKEELVVSLAKGQNFEETYVHVDTFSDLAKELKIFNLDSFFKSSDFEDQGYRLEGQRIVRDVLN